MIATSTPSPVAIEGTGSSRTDGDALFRAHLASVYRRRDRVFVWLMIAQWVFAIALAFVYSPYGWEGKVRSTNLHVYYALFCGGALSIPVILLGLLRPGSALTRHVVAVSQMLWSALLIHLTGGRIETHFHIFGSLAFLAFYRDWRVVLTATVVVAGDHLLRGLAWPESVYGITNPEWWRFLEHAGWVIFEDIVLVVGIAETLREMKALAARQAETETLNATIEQKVVDRTKELEASREQYRSLVETTRTVPWQMDLDPLRFTYVGPQAGRLLDCSADEWLHAGFWEARLHPDDRAAVEEHYLGLVERPSGKDVEFRMKRGNGQWVWVRSIVSSGDFGAAPTLRGLLLDITEHRLLEIELRQAQKLESVGRLASGIAHEINTPIQFVSDSIHFIREAFGDTFPLLDRYKSLREAAASGALSADLLAEIEEAEQNADISYLAENVPKALERSIDGLGRVATLVRSMKEFAHPDQNKQKAPADINHALTTTLTIARNEYKYVADVETEFGELPLVPCHVGELNQAFLNIIVNASHAIADAVKGTETKGRIKVATRRDGEHVAISISDTGTGIPESARGRIFDPFFTTKEVGKGTGQGLALARSAVVDKHGGTLTFETEMGRGTTFTLRLPLVAKSQAVPAVAA